MIRLAWLDFRDSGPDGKIIKNAINQDGINNAAAEAFGCNHPRPRIVLALPDDPEGSWSLIIVRVVGDGGFGALLQSDVMY